MASGAGRGVPFVLNPAPLHPALTLLDDFAGAQPDFSPHRYGVVAACDGGLVEVAGLSVPIGALCRVAHGPRSGKGGR